MVYFNKKDFTETKKAQQMLGFFYGYESSNLLKINNSLKRIFFNEKIKTSS